MTSDLDLRERRELCDLFHLLGPDAPTLSGDWTTADLAAHLLVREADLIGAPGILIAPLAGVTEKRMRAALDRHGYGGVVERVRSGPPFGPMRIRKVGATVNLLEYFVHHEDVRRANGEGPRTDRPELQDGLWQLIGRFAPLMVRKARVKGIELRLVRTDGSGEHRTGSGTPVTISGAPSELVLELYGRRSVAEVTYEGDEAAIAVVRTASFGV
jgi:uncharacterized protein (TIGR03085 family)